MLAAGIRTVIHLAAHRFGNRPARSSFDRCERAGRRTTRGAAQTQLTFILDPPDFVGRSRPWNMPTFRRVAYAKAAAPMSTPIPVSPATGRARANVYCSANAGASIVLPIFVERAREGGLNSIEDPSASRPSRRLQIAPT